MTPLWTAAEIAAATGGTAHGDFTANGVAFDSREIIGGELFVAMPGAAMDGHAFVPQALERGAAGLLVSQPADAPHVRVAEPAAALTALAEAARDRSAARRIGVTGSVGKTGVKEAIRAALTRFAPDTVHASVKSYNNHTGVPLSLARMPRETRFGIFEMGMNHASELTALAALVRPDIAVVTWIASAHIEHFADEAAIADAKAEIFTGLQPGGTAIIPFDSPHHARLRAAAEPHAAHIVSFGIAAGADVRAESVALHPDCSCVTARVGDQRLTFKVGMAGRHWVGNALAVLAAVAAAGGDLALAGLALAELTDLPGRGQRLRVAARGGSAVLIDESYNANPASMAASLAVLAEVVPRHAGRRLAVLGAMRELGDQSDRFHAELAPHIVAAGVSCIILVGNEMKPLAGALARQLEILHVTSADAATAEVERLLAADDVLLVKGSNSVRLGDVVATLKGREDAS
ncbi:UDP-N-acetylmuramoyl-tripeptide--D-alanyl-D-alanine ligase [Polymorphobacter fuscus]|uniref:UDP-N-acetylmuramoyl-tripeptide--D-alanyl-D-alanine ligase n=1 Tax=Sandarakinorhabdus fusca TaxID=1439888 RepID=A0A7C9GT66_9SPHN|nr:UDP-N-acetylmuramoyl-tripeptide--D-alanyl-D-alanine ligase [Polymorphobacter fuscus]KAB7644465.1 UDP-N-acetylmuramoyl-tripeptide--D-alanyl-D-alanine ligase [Polymorphobacter fuscus]MQT18391.1 UDP-N-acetylmuramoyl-tripeptide--D-alanyl-D-alanine ligase [Polymorphobacter fuscus]NJC08291.1 UDP-N-acetylmuramoyl-tripeptide--D-alanyl-D-alanine ligase [Polymorphobacter fuscus]